MWWAGTERAPASYWLSEHCVARVLGGAGSGELERVAIESVDAGLDQLAAWLAPRRGRRATLWLGGQLCRLMTVPAVQGVQSLAEAATAARVALEADGLVPPGYRFALHECPADQALWRGSVTHAALVPAEAPPAWQARLGSMRPWWSWALARSADGGQVAGARLAFDGEALTTLARDAQGQLLRAESSALPGGQAAWERLWRRQQAAVAPQGQPGEVTASFATLLRWDASPRVPSDAESQAFGFAAWTEVLA